MKKYGINYFSGCSSSEGFFSFFSEIYPCNEKWKAYIIKGGAGTGKSTLIKKLACELENRGYEVERIHCSSDPGSLDGALCRELHFFIADGTKPHIIEPLYPGAVENIINLGEYWNSEFLYENSEEIIKKTKLNSMCHERCMRFLSAAGKVKYDTERLCESSVLEYKIHAYADRFSKRRFKKKKTYAGKERKIFLSAVTPEGITYYNDTVKEYAREIILLDDKTSLASGMLIEEVKNLALKNGYDVISSFCPLNPSGFPEHIIIPALSLAFVKNHSSFPSITKTRIIHCDRFLDTEKLSKIKNRLAFNQRIQNELINEAVISLKRAKLIHDEIEKIYISAMDFSYFDEIKNRIISQVIV